MKWGLGVGPLHYTATMLDDLNGRSCFVHFESMTMLLMSFCAHEPSFLVHSARAWGRDAQIHHSHVNISGVDD